MSSTVEHAARKATVVEHVILLLLASILNHLMPTNPLPLDVFRALGYDFESEEYE